jgi:sterol desaturase/sphingolipid hydroxylase (fatty acid hydroxylase superfamily)
MQPDSIAPRLGEIQNGLLAGGVIVLLLLESLQATGRARRGWIRWRHILRNASLWLVTIVLFNVLFGGSAAQAIPSLDRGRIGVLYFLGLPLWAHAIASLLLYDLADYTFHRLSHEVRWLWLLHATHHTDDAMDVSTFVRAHPLHFFVTIVWKIVAVAAIGVPYWVMLLRETCSIPVVQLHHAAVRWPEWLDRALRWLIVTPNMHQIHHSPQARETNSNYTSLVPWWDWIFKTYVRRPPSPARVLPQTGLNATNNDSWQSVRGMLMTPLWARRYVQL